MKKIKRQFHAPKTSFFLFGPRAVGKSTWLKTELKADLTIDLLHSQTFMRFSQHPEDLRNLIEANPKWKRVIIDEIQKLPQLLDEIHSLIFDKEDSLQFILTGSSARKLKATGVNLLAGRALVRRFHSFTANELGPLFNLDEALKFGMLPRTWGLETAEEKIDYLYSYIETYLKEEIQQEALTRNLPAYSAFLEHMALRNSHVINLQGLSNQIGVARTTLKGYLDILEDTLLGFTLPAIELKAKVKEVATPKFYFFDIGVIRGLSQTLQDPLDKEVGPLLETYILHELMSFSDNKQKHWQFYYWATPTESEVDFVVSEGRRLCGIEVKASKRWEASFNRGLNILLDSNKIQNAYGVYMGNEIIKSERITVIPAKDFSAFLQKRSLLEK